MLFNAAAWLLLAATALASGSGHSIDFVPDHVLRVTMANISVACESRASVVVNGTSPGPAIHLLPGAGSWIRVYNDLHDQNLTMHWHGLAQRFAPFADGSPQASQWPIPPGHFFDYEVEPQLNDSGTYFYHSHVGMQALSAYGGLIVEDCGKAPFEYDDERVLVWGDYFRASDEDMEHGLLNQTFKWTGETMGVLLNGQGIGDNHTVAPGPKGGSLGFFGGGYSSKGYDPLLPSALVSTSNQEDPHATCSLGVIDVEPGKTYRFRMIGGTGLSFLTMALEDHGNFTIVQVDGSEYNAPLSTDHIQIGSGQRFDLLFKAKSASEIQAMKKSTFYWQVETRDRPTTHVSYVVVRYDRNVEVPVGPPQPLFTLPVQMGDWLEYSLTPLRPEENIAPTAAEVTRRLIIDCVQKKDPKTNLTIWELAHLPWTETSVHTPVLVDIYQRGEAAVPDYDAAMKNYGWDPKTLTFPVKVGEVLEIVLQNTGSLLNNGGGLDSHPFHIHGQHAYDYGSGNGTYNATENEEKIRNMGYKPVKRDTTMLHRYRSKATAGLAEGWRVWRIRIEQAGVWMVHCHTLAHMVMGMQSVWVVGNAAEIQQIPLDAAQGYFVYGGSVLGNDTNEPSVYEYFNGTKQCRPVHVASRKPSDKAYGMSSRRTLGF